MTLTEKLEAQFTGLLNSPVNSWKPTHILVRQLKEICKEAGLKFVFKHRVEDAYDKRFNEVEEIEI